MSTTTEQRPPQVTYVAWLVMLGSGFVLVTVWDQIARLRSLDTRASIEEFLTQPIAGGLGLDVESVISILHVSGLITAACAAAAIVLGWHVRHRHQGARLALTVIAVPLFVTGMIAGGFMSVLVAGAPIMLWLSPAREWFSTGRWTPPVLPEKADARALVAAAPRQESAVTTPPPAMPPAPPPATAPRPELYDRPSALVAAFVLSVLGAGLVLVTVGFAVMAMTVAPDLIMEEVERQRPELLDAGVSEAQLRASTVATGSVVIIWCVAALCFAGFAMARRSWGRVGLLVLAAISAGACLVSTLALPPALVPGVACIVTVALLRRRDVRAWFDPVRRDGMRP